MRGALIGSRALNRIITVVENIVFEGPLCCRSPGDGEKGDFFRKQAGAWLLSKIKMEASAYHWTLFIIMVFSGCRTLIIVMVYGGCRTLLIVTVCAWWLPAQSKDVIPLFPRSNTMNTDEEISIQSSVIAIKKRVMFYWKSDCEILDVKDFQVYL